MRFCSHAAGFRRALSQEWVPLLVGNIQRFFSIRHQRITRVRLPDAHLTGSSRLLPQRSALRPVCRSSLRWFGPLIHRVEDGNNFALRNLRLHEEGNDFVLYLSIPFCRARCKACPYYIDVLRKNDHKGKEDAYIDALLKDIRHWASFPKWNTGRLRAVYLGGGTGSILKTANLKGIVDTVFGSFRAADDCCFTLEGNARDFDDEKLDYVANSRISRISLGVQSFQPEILRIVGSPHAAEQSIEIIRKLQARGFHNIQMDLMFNMPEHTIDIWRKDL